MKSSDMPRNKALITGASAGIGEAFARELAARQYDLILVARRRQKLEILGRELEGRHGVACEVLPADLADEIGIETVAGRIRETNDLTMLINNAGFGTIGMFTEVDINRHLDMIKVHIIATVRLCHAALPAMIANRRGDIINVSSVSGFMDNPGGATYNPTKAYLNSFSQTLRNEVEDYGVRVQALCPGFTLTEFHEVGDFTDFVRDRVPKRWWMTSEYVVRNSLKGLEKGKVLRVPHIRYKAIVTLYRNQLISRLLRPIMIRKSWRKK